MKFTFAVKVPMRERLKILWRGGMFVRIEYNGQFKTAKATFHAMPARDVSGKVKKEK